MLILIIQCTESQNSQSDENTACWAQQEKCTRWCQSRHSDYKCDDSSAEKHSHSEETHSARSAS